MKTIKCDKCNKVIEGYNEGQVEYLLAQHKLAKHKVQTIESIKNEENK